MKKAEIDRKFDAIVEFSGLADFIDTPVKRYSTGMYARLGFSVAAHVDPDILIVDEVLSVGDVVFQNRCLERMNTILRSGATVIFVSHNLRAIAELCPRSVLLEHGKITATGPSQLVMDTYLEHAGAESRQNTAREVGISRVKVRRSRTDSVAYDSGEKIWVDVDVDCKGPCDPFSVVVFLNDEKQYEAFHTSTEYLGCPPISMAKGDRFSCTFELDLNLAGGTFYLGVELFRFENEETLHNVYPAQTIFVNTLSEVRGVVNPRPKVTAFELVRPGEPRKEAMKL